MGYPIQRIPTPAQDPQRRSADRARLLERVAIGLAQMTISSVAEIFAAGGTPSAPLDFAETYNPN